MINHSLPAVKTRTYRNMILSFLASGKDQNILEYGTVYLLQFTFSVHGSFGTFEKKRGFFCFVFNWQRSQYISLKYSQKRQQTILMLNTNFSVTSNTTMNQAADMLQYFTSKAAAFHQHCAQVNSIYFNAVCKTGNSSWK